MNQSVIFPDIQTWRPELQCIIFPVQVSGISIECRLSLYRLQQLTNTGPIPAQQVLAVFEENRFDIEDRVEELIDQEQYDEQMNCLML